MSEVLLEVEAYNDDHEKLLLGGPRGSGFAKLFREGLRANANEILVHAMFAEQKNFPGWKTYQELTNRVLDRAAKTRDYFDFGGEKIVARFSGQDAEDSETERVGVGCGILAINRVVGLTEADWRKVPESNKSKTLDHVWDATNGKQSIRVEAKGRIVDRPSVKTPSISSAKSDIEAKKRASGPSKTPQTEDYGLIAALSSDPKAPSRLYVLDPPGDGVDGDPRSRQILNRLRYYAFHLRLVRRFHMLAALANRIVVLEERPDVTPRLDGVVLVDIDGEQHRVPSWLNEGLLRLGSGVVGRTFFRGPNDDGPVPFLGFHTEVFEALVAQDWTRLLEMRWPPGQPDIRETAPRVTEGYVQARYCINSAGIAYGEVRAALPNRRDEATW